MQSKFIFLFLLLYSTIFPFQVKNIVGPISEKELIEPKFSPNNHYISATTPGYQRIIIFSFPELKVIDSFDYPGIGYNYKWSNDENNIICREEKYKNKRKFYRISLIDIKSNSIIPLTDYQRDISTPLIAGNNVVYYQSNNKKVINIQKKLDKTIPFNKQDCISYNGRIFLNSDFKIANQNQILLAPQIEHNGKFLVTKVAGGPLKIFFKNGNIKEIGDFVMPTISKDGKYIVMAQTKDDGHVYTESKLYIYDVTSSDIIPIDGLDNFIPVNPSISNDNRYIIFEDIKSSKVYFCELVK